MKNMNEPDALIEHKDETDIGQVKRAVDGMLSAFDEFKKANDVRLKEIEKRGSADPLIEEKLNKIQDAMDAAEEAKKAALAAETKAGRSRLSGESKDLPPQQAEYKKAFEKYLRKGHDNGLGELQEKAMSVGSDSDGGYFVLPERSNEIIQLVTETSPMRQLANVITISTDAFEQPRRTSRASTGGWVSEQGTRNQTNSPQLGMLRVPVHEMYAEPAATQKILDDSAMDVEAWLAGQIADEFSFLENTAFVHGSGVGQPLGFLNVTAGTSGIDQIEQVGSGSSAVVTTDSLIAIQAALKDPYQPNATWLMNRLVKRNIRQLKNGTTGQYLWEPGAWAGLPQGVPDTLLGKPVVMASDMPVAAANSLSVAYGDFKKGYTIVDRIGIRVIRDNLTAKPNILFYTTKRVGGSVVNGEAIKLLKLA